MPKDGIHQLRLQQVAAEEVTGIGLGKRPQSFVRVAGLDHRRRRNWSRRSERPAEVGDKSIGAVIALGNIDRGRHFDYLVDGGGQIGTMR